MNIQEKKEKTAQLFTKELITAIPEEVSKVFLFGSALHGKPNRDGDIDLIIFAKYPRKILNKIKNLAFDFLLKKMSLLSLRYIQKKIIRNLLLILFGKLLKKGKRFFNHGSKTKIKI